MIDLRLGDCIEVLKTLPDNSVDSIVTDPPYHLTSIVKRFGKENSAPAQFGTDGAFARASKGFMGKEWDGGDIAFRTEVWKECYRVLKPGGHLLSFGGSRTYHRMAVAIEDAGFEVRDQIMWVYGSGFPKSHNIGKAIDKMGIDNEWEGWGTALKPAHEPICMARKPLTEKSIAENVLKWGTGGINIDDCRIGYTEEDKENINFDRPRVREKNEDWVYDLGITWENPDVKEYNTEGRFPANIMFDEEAGKLLDEQSGVSKSTSSKGHFRKGNTVDDERTPKGAGLYGNGNWIEGSKHNDTGGASRFFYCPKVSKKERGEGNIHPTVKPIKLMEYLIKLVTPKDGVVLEPFMGSGSTGIAAKNLGMSFIGIEKEQEYFDIAKQRIGE